MTPYPSFILYDGICISCFLCLPLILHQALARASGGALVVRLSWAVRMDAETVPGLQALELLSSADGLLTAELHNSRPDCAVCGEATRKGARLSVTLQDLPRGWQPVRLQIYYRRFECRQKHEQEHPLVTAGLRASSGRTDLLVTRRLLEALFDRYLRGETVPSLATWSGVAQASLWKYFSAALDDKLSIPRDTTGWGALTHIGLDEMFWRGSPLGVVVDLRTSRLIDLLPDRLEDTFEECLRELKQIVEEERRGEPGSLLPLPEWRPVITTDMWGPFRVVARRVFGPDVLLVVDRFHLAAKISEDLQAAAQALLPADRDRPAKLRQLRADYLRSLKDRTARCTLEVDEVLHARLTDLLELATAMQDIWRADDLLSASKALDDWTFRVLDLSPAGTHRPFSRLAHLLVDWRHEVLNYHRPEAAMKPGVRSGPTNAQTEQVNGTLRRLEQRSHAAPSLGALLPGQDGSMAERYQHQERHLERQFQRFYVKAMHAVNVPRPERQVMTARAPDPALKRCHCGLPAERLPPKTTLQNTWDLPVGDHPVRLQSALVTARCPDCGHDQRIGTRALMTVRLQEALTRQASLGRPLGRLSRESGLAPGTLRKHLVLPELHGRASEEAVGLLRWVWHGQLHWLVTDIRSGRPLDLLPDAPGVLVGYLGAPAAAPVRRVFMSRPDLSLRLPGEIRLVMDAFSAVRVVLTALKEVQRRFTGELTAAELRYPELQNHRKLLLTNPLAPPGQTHRQAAVTSAARVTRLLEGDELLKTAYDHIQSFRAVLAREVTTAAEAQGYVRDWMTGLHLDPAHASSPNRRVQSAHFAFRDVQQAVHQYQGAVACGMVARSTEGLSLASSTRRLQMLQALESARGFDLETLRRAVLGPLGGWT